MVACDVVGRREPLQPCKKSGFRAHISFITAVKVAEEENEIRLYALAVAHDIIEIVAVALFMKVREHEDLFAVKALRQLVTFKLCVCDYDLSVSDKKIACADKCQQQTCNCFKRHCITC